MTNQTSSQLRGNPKRNWGDYMEKACLILAVLGTPIVAAGQTNSSYTASTNIIHAASAFRDVNGQLYSPDSKIWKTIGGKIALVQEDGVVVQTFKTKNNYELVFVAGDGGNLGAQGSTSDHYSKRLVSSEQIPEKRIFIKHFLNGAVDQRISVAAIKTGTVQVSGTVFEAWDCGTTPTTERLSQSKAEDDIAEALMKAQKADAMAKAAERKKQAETRALKSNQDATEKGDSFGLMRMGERYRDGDGVEKDLVKAKEYLQKSADAGSPTAKEELSKLNQP